MKVIQPCEKFYIQFPGGINHCGEKFDILTKGQFRKKTRIETLPCSPLPKIIGLSSSQFQARKYNGLVFHQVVWTFLLPGLLYLVHTFVNEQKLEQLEQGKLVMARQTKNIDRKQEFNTKWRSSLKQKYF